MGAVNIEINCTDAQSCQIFVVFNLIWKSNAKKIKVSFELHACGIYTSSFVF